MPRPSANWFLFSFAGVLAAGPLEAPAEEASAVRNAVARVGGDALRERAVEIPINDLQSSTASVTAVGPDVTFCQLYGLGQYGRLGSVVGLAIATTSWNVGNLDLRWWAAPDEEHPYIVSNLYRLHNDRLEQIGQSWIKHGFFALADTQCGGTCHYEPGHGVGNWLGQGCTDTYDASLNAMQSGLGPRQESIPGPGNGHTPDRTSRPATATTAFNIASKSATTTCRRSIFLVRCSSRRPTTSTLMTST